MPHRLAVENVIAGYGRISVLRDLSFSVPAGSVCALLGPNGAGKTTTLGVISGGIEATEGRVLFDGRNINRLSAYERATRGITLIPEGRGVFPGLCVHDNLEAAAHAPPGMHADSRRYRLDRVLDMFPRLRERREQRAGT